MKIVVVVLLLFVLVSLAYAVYCLLKGDRSEKMIKAFMWRVGLSIVIVALLGVGSFFGVVEPKQPSFLSQ